MSNEHIGDALGFLDALTGNIEVARVPFNPDEPAPHLDCGNACRSGAHERIKDGRWPAELLYTPEHQGKRLLRRVPDTLCIRRSD